MKAWQHILQAAQVERAALDAACHDTLRQQADLLLRILRGAQATQFGKRHRFSDLHGVVDYRNAVPITAYEAFAPWIERIAAGESHVLAADPAIAFEETGGSSDGAKLVPYTASSLVAFRAAVLPWLAALTERRPAICAGPAYVAVSPRLRPARSLPCGIRVGLHNEAAYLGPELHESLAQLLIVPATLEADADRWRVSTLAALIAREDLAFIAIYSPTFLLELMDALPRLADEVERVLHRADQMLAIARMHAALSGSTLSTQRLWPRLDTIAAWTDGASHAYAQRLRTLFPHARVDPRGVLATESAVTIRIDEDEGCVPALTSAFMEFVDRNGTARLAHELTVTEIYRVVLTTPGGLYRYDLQDEFQCSGFRGAVPRLKFLGRAGMTSDLVGEKLSDAFVARSLGMLSLPAALAPVLAPTPHYELWIDGCASSDVTALARHADDLLKANPQYDYARTTGQLAPIRVVHYPGLLQHRHRVLASRGVRAGDLKASSLILDRSTLPSPMTRP